MSDQPSNPENGQTTAHTDSKLVRKKCKVKANTKKQSDSHEGRPKSSLTYWKKAIEGNKLKGPELAMAIQRIEAYEQEKGTRKSGKAEFLSGFPVNASPEVQAFWLRRFGHMMKGEKRSPAEHGATVSPAKSDAEDSDSEPAKSKSAPIREKTPAQTEGERVAAEKKLAKERLNASAFLNQVEWDKYVAVQKDCFLFNKVRYILPDGSARSADMTAASTDPYCVKISESIRMKARPSPSAVLKEEPKCVSWVEPLLKSEDTKHTSPSDRDRYAALNLRLGYLNGGA